MKVEDVFVICHRGTVVTGTVQRGCVRVGDKVLVVRPSGQFQARVDGIEAFRKMLTAARKGQEIAILLREVERGQVAHGDLLTGA